MEGERGEREAHRIKNKHANTGAMIVRGWSALSINMSCTATYMLPKSTKN
jgi:hypothetical protein